MAKDKQTKHKERGFWASFWIILFALQSLLFFYLIYDMLYQVETIDKPILLGSLVAVTLADLVALGAIWFWQRWGWYIFAISTVISIVVGLIATATQLIVFHEVMPLVILGWVYKDKWDYFNK